MTPAQVEAVFTSIHTRTTKVPPYRVGVLMRDGQLFAGTAQPVNANGLIELAVDRRALAHLMQPPEIIWLDVTAIEAITDNEVLTPPPVVVVVDSRKDGIPETQEGQVAHDDKPQV